MPAHPGDVPPPGADDEAVTPRGVTLGVTFLATVLLVSGLAVVPSPYVVKSPGPTRDTLGQVDDEDLITIEGAETYESTGELLLTTVGVGGGPGYPVNLVQVLQGWADGTRAVFPVEEVFPADTTQEELDASSAADMTSSQENATYAALHELGYEIPVEVTVLQAVEGSGAEGHVEEGDVITTVAGTPIEEYEDLTTALDGTEAGAPVTLGVLRDGVPVELSFPSSPDPQGGDGARLGVFVSPAFDFPVDVSIRIDDIGGPSAGTMFALGIIDRLTEVDEANGEIIAGTGTIDTSGTVGPIGGIQQKLHGALRDGAAWFLAPADNCSEVYGHVPDGLTVVRVETLSDALAATTAIGSGDTADLPTCTADDVAASR
ncbi:YlbL family protein [Sanguibacter suaedae]|uniref:PDZ domain-containing protein n=1 Tax=Sanguibacter suaedae TaxID=2795737 RepID=A0A934IE68_9MICO|nr:S16 family serine protease [Sanguibacter suaedae]MBI9116100.1 PDZ domain-containing protein [Sanguibacter suaedae]